MLGVTAALFRKLLPAPVAIFAFTLLALDEAHAVALTWICNRAAFISIAFSVLALDRYVAHRRGGSARWPVAATAFYALAFGFGEYAVCLLAYLFAFEACEGTEPWKVRLRALVPMLLPAFIFLCLRGAVGASVRRSGVYVDPIGEPVDFFKAVLVRVPVFIGDLALAVPSEYWTFGLPWTVAWAQIGWLPISWVHDPEPWRAVQLGIGVLACVLLALLARFTLRRERNPNVRWLFLGSILSLVPVSGSYPSSRLLLTALLGFTPLVASFVVLGVRGVVKDLRTRPVRAVALGLTAATIAVYQLVMSVAWQRIQLFTMLDGSIRVREAILRMPVDDAKFPEQDLVLLTALEGGTSMYLPLTRQRYGRTAPRSCLFLSYLIAPYDLVRDAPNAFTVRFHGTDALLGSAAEQLLRSPKHPFAKGDTIDVDRWRITVLDVLNGKPQYLRVEFDRKLEDPSLLFMALTPDGYRPFFMPPIGDKVVIFPAVLPNLPESPHLGHAS
jgi:hypothetical protein